MVSDANPKSNSPARARQVPPQTLTVRLPMHRPPLRAKTGCLRCRKRRKKCDELKPVCGDCARLRFTCTWPSAATVQASQRPASSSASSSLPPTVGLTTLVSLAAPSAPGKGSTHISSTTSSSSSSSASASSSSDVASPTSPTSEPREPEVLDQHLTVKQIGHAEELLATAAPASISWPGFTRLCQQISTNPKVGNDTEYRLLDKSPQILNLLICPTADASCRDFSGIIQIALQEQWLRDSMLAFAASIMASSAPGGHMQMSAVQLYQKAITGLRKNVVDSGSTKKQQMILVAVNFLGLLETLCSVEADRPIVHFVASAKLLSLLRHESSWNMSSATNTFYRVMVEDAVYNIACLAIYIPGLDVLARQINWNDLESFFPSFLAPDGTCYTSNYRTSPFLGGRRDVYYLMFDITHFARQDVPEAVKREKIISFREQLRLIDAGIKSYFDGNVPAEVAAKYSDKYKLHVLCLRIYIHKVEDPTCTATSYEIASAVQHCLELLETRDLLEHLNPALCWPILILACATHSDGDFEIVQEFSVELRSIIDKGHGDRLGKAMRMLWRLRNPGPGDHVKGRDGLELLLKKRGIFQ